MSAESGKPQAGRPPRWKPQNVKTETFYSCLESAAMNNGERKVGELRLDSDNAVSCMFNEASGRFHRVEIKFIACGNCNSIGGREVWRQPHQWSFKRKGLSRGEGGWSVPERIQMV